MTRLKKFYFLIFIGLCLFSFNGYSEPQIEHISNSQVKELDQLFKISAPISSSNALQKLDGTLWSCELFGVRTRMQKLKDVRLYQFVMDNKSLANVGSQKIKNYHISNGSLTGSQDTLQDQIKMTSGSNLISKLSTTGKHSKAVAYATCAQL
ncbi:MAG: hypothetical protein KDD34_06175 [Bdellovibrionales bacterium]|nr:hypothetical protein [Bdellovibrionales bacterium]